VQLWFYFNILSIFVEPFYFNLFIPFLHPEGKTSEADSTDNFQTEMSVTAVSLNADGTEPLKEEEDDDANNLALVKDMVDHKKHIEFVEDFHAMTFLTMIRSNQRELLLPARVIGKGIFNSFMLFFL